MPVIKRYPNRKLYDTAAKQYVSLDGIAELIRGGADVQVVDYTTGEDLTALILMQVIVEQEKKQERFPAAVGACWAGSGRRRYCVGSTPCARNPARSDAPCR